MIDIVSAMRDQALFGEWFSGSSWDTWQSVLKAAYCLPMTRREIELFRAVADRDPPKRRVKELWCVVGRRGGKDSIASLVAAHAAAFVDYRPHLRAGERAMVWSVACDRDQAKVAMEYTKAYFTEVPLLRSLVQRETAEGLELSTGATIAVSTNSFRSVRARSVAVAILDEVAYWRDETSATPDVETYAALLPAMSTMPGAMLVGISSPYKTNGLLYDRWKDHFGKDDDDVLVIRAASRVMNSKTLSQETVDAAYAKDRERAAAEYGASWRTDLATFIDRAMVEAAVETGRLVRPPIAGVKYYAFCDPSGGVGDAFTLGIAHKDGNDAVLDLLFERKPPFSPPAVVSEIAGLLKTYKCSAVTGDRYSAQWVVASFRECGIEYRQSARDRSAIYLDALPLFAAGQVQLLDNKRLVQELAGLERRTVMGGRDRVDHAQNSHDDLANSACGALVETRSARQPMRIDPRAVERMLWPGSWGTEAPWV